MRFGSRAFSALSVFEGLRPTPRALVSRSLLVGGLVAATLIACTSETPDFPTADPATPAVTTPSTDAGSADALTSDGSNGSSTFTPPPTCTSWNYSDWSPCHYNGSQTRTVVTGIPAGCYGGGPVLRQSCEFTVPTDAAGLYEAYCADCHLNAKKGKTASQITNAINGNAGGMSVLADKLSPAQIDLIASVK